MGKEGGAYVGLLTPFIQSQRNPQPDCRAAGNAEHWFVLEPPYWAPQTAGVAFHSRVQASKRPKPPPGICVVIQQGGDFLWNRFGAR